MKTPQHLASKSNSQPADLLRKVCGMRQAANISALLELEPDFVGFIFYPRSARFVGEELSVELLHRFPEKTKKVGVFVDAAPEAILSAVNQYQLEAVQLHGGESPELCCQLRAHGLLVFKAFAVDEHFDFAALLPYEGCCDYYLFDTKGQQYGGNGTTFNWDLLQQYRLNTPFFLSGGIDLEHADQIARLALPALKGIDINSRFETQPALKDIGKVASFFKKLA